MNTNLGLGKGTRRLSSLSSTPRRNPVGLDPHQRRINRFAQVIAREEIIREQPVLVFDANTPTDRMTLGDLRRNFNIHKLLHMLRRNVLAVDIQQDPESTFSRYLLTRILYEDLIDIER